MKERALDFLKVMEGEIAANRLILPSLPEVAIRVRQLTADPNCSVRELEQQIAKDAAITARLIKVANSAALLRGSPITSLRQAILGLGYNLVRSLVNQLAILQTMQGCKDKDPARLEGFVASGLRISALCHAIAQKHPHLDPELAALGGLLHDIGKLPMRDYLLDYAELSADERLRFELILHPYVGALLLKHWQLSDELVQMAYLHERILRDTKAVLPDYVDIVIAANLMHYGIDAGRYQKYATAHIPALEKCFPGDSKLDLEGTVEARMELASNMIDA